MKALRRPTKLAAIALVAMAATFAASAPAYGHAPSQAQAAFETAFMQETIDHHFSGVEMAELCLDKATSQKLRRVCSDIATGQAKEIRVLRRWLDDWYDIEKEPELMPADQQMLAELAALEGREFDVALSAAFIEHHRVQIGRSQDCLGEAFHGQLIKLCKEQIRVQSQEIRVFEKVIAGMSKGRQGNHGDHTHDHAWHNGHRHERHHGHDEDAHGDDRGHERDDD